METLELKQEKQVRKMVRHIGNRKYEGTLTKENGVYSYYYPYGAELGKKMTLGDIDKIAKLSKLSRPFVIAVLQGKRWNVEIIRNAEIFAKRNVEMGFLD